MPLLIGFGVKANVHDLFILVDGKNKPITGTYITLECKQKKMARNSLIMELL